MTRPGIGNADQPAPARSGLRVVQASPVRAKPQVNDYFSLRLENH